MYSGRPFWSGLKRLPHEIKLDLSDPLHIQMIHSTANLYAILFNLPTKANPSEVTSLAVNILSQAIDRANSEQTEEMVEESDEEEDKTNRKQKEAIEIVTLSTFKLDQKQRPRVIKLDVD